MKLIIGGRWVLGNIPNRMLFGFVILFLLPFFNCVCFLYDLVSFHLKDKRRSMTNRICVWFSFILLAVQGYFCKKKTTVCVLAWWFVLLGCLMLAFFLNNKNVVWPDLDTFLICYFIALHTVQLLYILSSQNCTFCSLCVWVIIIKQEWLPLLRIAALLQSLVIIVILIMHSSSFVWNVTIYWGHILLPLCHIYI